MTSVRGARLRLGLRARVTSSRAEAGSVTPLIVAYALILLLLVGVVTVASAAFLRQRALAAAADGAALAATRALDADAVRTIALSTREAIPLDGTAADSAVRGYLATTGAEQRLPGLTLVAVTVENGAVRVTLRSTLQVPFAAAVLSRPVSVEASAVAEGVVLPLP